jgi:hypothetical protein
MLSVHKLVFAGALLAVVPFAAVAQEKKAEPKAMPTDPKATPAVTATSTGACGTAEQQYTIVKKTVMVPTQVQETRTVNKSVTKQETYTAYKYETVQEKKMVDVTTYKKVTETVMENRTTTHKVPVWEEKTVMEHRKKIEWVNETKERSKLTFVKEEKVVSGGGLFSHGGGGGGLFGGPVCQPLRWVQRLRQRLRQALPDHHRLQAADGQGMLHGLQAQVRDRVRPGLQEGLHLQVRDQDRVRAGLQDQVRPGLREEGSDRLQEGLRPVPGHPLRDQVRAVHGNRHGLQDGPDLRGREGPGQGGLR